MTIVPKSDTPEPSPPEPKGPVVHPLLALSLAVSLATTAGLLMGWPSALTVFLAVLSVLGGPRFTARQ